MLRCKNCGSTLEIKNGVYVCESCGSEFAISDFAENIDVCICYIESDERGARTKDSVIGQDIYQALESKKIKTFYGRISASELIGADFEKACNSAVNSAKAIVVIGTEKSHFEKLLDKYQTLFDGKVVLPVYADMNAYDIPKALNAIQALDYNKVGSLVDLSTGVLKTLGREEEQDFIALSQKSTKKKKTLWIIVAIVLLLLFGCGLFALMHYGGIEENSVAEASRETPSLAAESSEESVEDLELTKYNEAITAKNSEDYSKAIDLFAELGNYKDSQDQLFLLYQKYAGYYYDASKNLSFRLRVADGNAAIIETEKRLSDGTRVKITENTILSGCTNELNYNDSENNQGVIKLTLKNDGIYFEITTTSKNSAYAMGNFNSTLLMSEKSDKPIVNITAEQLHDYVSRNITLEEIERSGYDLVFDSTITMGFDEYYFDNTDIRVFVAPALAVGETAYVLGMTAPASLVIPDKIGQQSETFIKDGVLYSPNGIFGTMVFVFGEDSSGEITADTTVAFANVDDDYLIFSDVPENIKLDVDVTINSEIPCEVLSDWEKWNTQFSEIVEYDCLLSQGDYRLVLILKITLKGYVNDERFQYNGMALWNYESYSFKLYDSSGEIATEAWPDEAYLDHFNSDVHFNSDGTFEHYLYYEIPFESAEYRLEISEYEVE